MDALIRSLEQASGDVVVVATVDTYAPYADIREYAVKMFENGGRGIGQRGRDNGLLVVLAVKERQVWVEVGYDLEQFITDGYAGETSRRVHGAGVPARAIRRRPAGGRVAHHRGSRKAATSCSRAYPRETARSRHRCGAGGAAAYPVHPLHRDQRIRRADQAASAVRPLLGRPDRLEQRRRPVRRTDSAAVGGGWRLRRRLWRVRRRPQRRRRRRSVVVAGVKAQGSSHKAQVHKARSMKHY